MNNSKGDILNRKTLFFGVFYSLLNLCLTNSYNKGICKKNLLTCKPECWGSDLLEYFLLQEMSHSKEYECSSIHPDSNDHKSFGSIKLACKKHKNILYLLMISKFDEMNKIELNDTK